MVLNEAGIELFSANSTLVVNGNIAYAETSKTAEVSSVWLAASIRPLIL